MKCCGWRGGKCAKPALEGGYCEEHSGSRRQSRQQLQRIYRGAGSSHQRNRLVAFRRDGWTCVRCGWQPACVRESKLFPETLDLPPESVILEELAAAYRRNRNHLHADHILDVETRPDLADDVSNLQTLCRDCHAIKTGKKRGPAK